jgi:hypothetical protein
MDCPDPLPTRLWNNREYHPEKYNQRRKNNPSLPFVQSRKAEWNYDGRHANREKCAAGSR